MAGSGSPPKSVADSRGSGRDSQGIYKTRRPQQHDETSWGGNTRQEQHKTKVKKTRTPPKRKGSIKDELGSADQVKAPTLGGEVVEVGPRSPSYDGLRIYILGKRRFGS